MSEERTWIINPYDVHRALGDVPMLADGKINLPDGRRLSPKGATSHTDYAGLARRNAPEVTEWVQVRGLGRGITGGWFPATAADRIKALVNENGKHLTVSKPGMPCGIRVVQYQGLARYEHTCDREVKGTSKEWGEEVPACGTHSAAQRRREAEAQRYAEESRQRQEQRDREKLHKKLAEDTLEWAGPLLAELGIHPATITVGQIKDKVGILLPAEAVATLVEYATGERYSPPDDLGDSTRLAHGE